jgi:hypothetical protein
MHIINWVLRKIDRRLRIAKQCKAIREFLPDTAYCLDRDVDD